MEVRDATANLTLGEIHLRELDNLELIKKSFKPYRFDNRKDALKFREYAHYEALRRLGIDYSKVREIARDQLLARNEKETQINAIFAKHDVWPEEYRTQRPGQTMAAGMYIRHNNEIAYFISLPLSQKTGKSKNSHIIVPGRIQYFIITNVN